MGDIMVSECIVFPSFGHIARVVVLSSHIILLNGDNFVVNLWGVQTHSFMHPWGCPSIHLATHPPTHPLDNFLFLCHVDPWDYTGEVHSPCPQCAERTTKFWQLLGSSSIKLKRIINFHSFYFYSQWKHFSGRGKGICGFGNFKKIEWVWNS